MFTAQARLLQDLLRRREVTESQDAGERVVELRLFAIERMLELVVREQRGIPGELVCPSERLGRGDFAFDSQRRAVDTVAVVPDPSDFERLLASIDGEARGHTRVAVVEVLPAVAPHLDALLPMLIGAEQDHLERLGER